MPPLDAGAWLAAISDDSPAGPNLEFDADFGALERAAQGKAEQQYGSTIIPAEEPDWKEVAALAQALLGRTRDLRVLAHLAVARLHLGGLPDFAEALQLVRQLLETRWAEIHPQLDAEDDNDPTLRGNALLRLAHPGLVLRTIRDFPLANSPRAGHYSWRDVAIATGAIESDAKTKPTETVIRSAFQDSDPAQLTALRAVAGAAAEAAAGIPAVFDANSGHGTGPDFDELIKLLKDVARTIERYAVIPTGTEGPTAPAASEAERSLPVPPSPVAPRSGAVSASQITEVTNRADALRLLDLVTQYYQRFEPSSPLPMLIDRARRLAEKNFLEVLRDMAPAGVDQAQVVVGTRAE